MKEKHWLTVKYKKMKREHQVLKYELHHQQAEFLIEEDQAMKMHSQREIQQARRIQAKLDQS